MESYNISSLLEYCDPETLVVCDIDNTLIESKLHMGSVQWRSHIRNKIKEGGYAEKEVEAIVDRFWLFAQHFVPVRYVDPATPSVLLQLQNSQIPVIALTARGPLELTRTERQLQSVGLIFHPIGLSLDPCTLPLPFPCIYEQGVIFCGENTKNEALAAFFKRMQYVPKRLVFIDDQFRQLQAIASLAEKLGISFVGIRFSGADARVKAFDSKVADFQWNHLPIVLSDDEAACLLNEKH